ncbi:hypothetical protein MKW98_000560 [Papaver atlanticum]|uniref:WAT1-related protein n=1 Tax=Papaver atlanticum TaxID=357466 RepID=A0AAD4X7X2_9MAGN|nr:hypothetical protein MKW98_000560 [Papaver atlanticum]
MADTSVGSWAKRICVVPTEKTQLHLAMLALQFGYAGFHVVSRAALNMGISKLVFPVYRNIIALLLLAPFAFFLEKKERPTMTLSFLVQFFFLALIGITANQGFYLLGASVITLYKGPAIFSPSPPTLRQTVLPVAFQNLGDASGKNWTLGCIYLIGHCLSWSGWLVLQAPVLKKYPARLSVTSYTCFFGVLQFLAIAAVVERESQAWLIHSGAELFSVFYAGFVASGIAFAVQIWCIDRGGPVFVAVYQPVQTLVVAIMASLALGEEFYLGGIIGAVFIIVGLYLVLWGKSEEIKFKASQNALIPSSAPEHHGNNNNNRASSHIKSSSLAQPLLPPSITEV